MSELADNKKSEEKNAARTSRGERFFSWLHRIHLGVAMKLGIVLVICIAALLITSTFGLSYFLSKELNEDAMAVLKNNTAIFYNNINTELNRIMKDAEHYSNIYINNYQNVANKSFRSMDAEEAKALLTNTQINNHFTELTSVFATTFVRQGEQFVRVNSSLQGLGNSSAVSTILDHDSPALPMLLQNKPYSGVVTLFGRQFISHYEPVSDKYGQVVGAVALGFYVQEALQPSIKEMLNIHIGENGYAYVLDGHFHPGLMIAHPLMSGQNVIDVTDADGYKRYADIIQRKNGMAYYNVSRRVGESSRRKVVVFQNIDKLGWIVATTAYVDEVEKSSKEVRISLLIFTALIIPVILLLIAVSSRYLISRRLKKVLGIAQTIAEGDLSRQVSADYNDEIGELLSAVEVMRVRLHRLVGDIGFHTGAVHAAAVNITEAVDGQASTSVQTSSSVAEITSTMEELSASSTQIAEHSRSVVDIANRTLQDCNKGSQSMAQLLACMKDIDTENQQSMREVMMLGNKSKEISRVMVIINSVADQTKLIAFNAALEAASAGEAGKRFSVVAAEIRRLADSVTDSTSEIENKISEIQNAIHRLVLNAEKGSDSIKAGTRACQLNAERINEIVDTAEQTSTAAMQISLSTQQ